jgi:periplasmic protein TonB
MRTTPRQLVRKQIALVTFTAEFRSHYLTRAALDTDKCNTKSWTSKPFAKRASGLDSCISGLDHPWKRLPIVASFAVIAWFGLLTLCGLFLSHIMNEHPEQTAVEIQLLEIPGAGSPPPSGPSASLRHSSFLSNATKSIPPRKAASHIYTARPQISKLSSDHSILRQRNRAAPPLLHHSTDEDSHFEDQAAPAIASATAPDQPAREPTKPQLSNAAASSAPAIVGNTADQIGRSGIDSSLASGSPGANGPAGGGTKTRPIYAPVPSIPDDLRDEVMQATAIARFHVARDGSATVSLIKRTDYSELDQLILDSLSQWRFEPAIRDGVPVESDAEVRIRIAVQ